MPISENAPVEYLTIGHLTKDLVGNGYTLGGTAAYASLTAGAFGLKAGLVTSCAADLDLQSLENIDIHKKQSLNSTTFENIEMADGRVQVLHKIAEPIISDDIPDSFYSSHIIHIGPVANEVDPMILDSFPADNFIRVTPQGWMRHRGNDGKITFRAWKPPLIVADRADAIVISVEDVGGDETIIHEYAHLLPLLAVTEGYDGARVYWHGDVRHFSAPKVKVLDPTGAGDIFAAVFFIRLQASRDPWGAAASAVNLASQSVTRKGLLGIPRPEEVQSNLLEIIKGSSSK